jgi:iron complex outermembrane receptor protein
LIDLRIFPKSAASYSGNQAFSGAIGGSLDLNNSPNLKNSLGIGVGSYGFKDANFSNRIKNNGFSWQQSTSYSSADNNISYKVQADQKETSTLTNSAFQQIQHQEELKVSIKRSCFFLTPWLGYKFRQLPASVISSPSEDWQTDSWYRLKLKVQNDSLRLKASILSGIDQLKYFNSQTKEQSLYRTQYIRGQVAKAIFSKSSFDLEASLSFRQEKIYAPSNPSLSKHWNVYSPAISAKFEKGNQSNLLSIHQDVFNGKLLNLRFKEDYTTYFHSWILGMSIIKNNRLPTLNDLYWPQGGNSSLKPEESWQFQPKVAKSFSSYLDVELNAYLINIDNYILWYPGASGYWQVGNIGTVRSKGVELKLSTSVPVRKGQLSLTHLFKYCNSAATSVYEQAYIKPGKQLLFVPKVTANAILDYQSPKISGQINALFTSQRYTGNDSEKQLTPFVLLNASVQKTVFITKKTSIDVQIRCENVLNTWYQWVPYYPQIGRTFNLNIQYLW